MSVPQVPMSSLDYLIRENLRLKGLLKHIEDAFKQDSPDPECCDWCATAAEMLRMERATHGQYVRLQRNAVVALRLLRDFLAATGEGEESVRTVSRSVISFLDQAVSDGFIRAEARTPPRMCKCGHYEHDGKCPIQQTDTTTDYKSVKCDCTEFVEADG